MKEIFEYQSGIRTVWSNSENPRGELGSAAKADNGRKGSPCRRVVAPKETVVIAEAKGCGVVRRIWMTVGQYSQPMFLKGFRLECFWDGAREPAVSVPVGDFFCFNSSVVSPMENGFFASPEGRSFNCTVPMPFKKGMRIEITNDNEETEATMFFYQVDYTLGDDVSDALYFHAYYNRETKTVMYRDYEILPTVLGHGRYLGASFGVIANPKLGKTWWGEGEVKCYIDSDAEYPSLAGTGTEDYIGTGWGQGRYICRYMGCTHADEEAMRYSFYRFHAEAPVWFSEKIRITIQQIGYQLRTEREFLFANNAKINLTKGGFLENDSEEGTYERFDDDWCSVAYFYLDKPSCGLRRKPQNSETFFGYV